MKTWINTFVAELDEQSVITRKMLERIPEDKYDWKPHEKSMSVRQLAAHLAELPGWIAMAITMDGLDFAATPYQETPVKNNKELMAFFEKTLADSRQTLSAGEDGKLAERWVLRAGDAILDDSTKAGVIRMSLNQIVHHRAQMGVFLRLLDVPIPASFGPSADEH